MSILQTFRLTPDQERAVMGRTDLSVSAGAGSGKTNTLTARYLRLVSENGNPRRVVAITFTDKATREMRNRIRRKIQEWRAEYCPPEELARWNDIYAALDAARIGTIHSLCAEILRAHPAEAEIDPRFGVMDEGRAAAIQAQVVQDTLAWAVGENALVPLFQTFEPKELVAVLAQLLKERLNAETGFANAAAWDEVMARALGEFLRDPRVLVEWDTLRELKDKGELDDDAGPKLAPQVEQLLAQWDEAERALAEKRTGEAAAILFEIRRKSLGLRVGSEKSASKPAVRRLQSLYDELLDPWLGGKNSGDAPPDSTLDARAREMVALLKGLFEHAVSEYQAVKDQRAELDFDDMERGAQLLLRRPEIRKHWQGQIDALLVDEFQDTNERQREIIEGLARTAEGQTGRLFIVGDPKQSIYRFRGADVTVFSAVRTDITTRGGAALELAETFRAHKQLIEPLNVLLGRVMDSDMPRRNYYTPFAKLKPARNDPAKVPAPFIEVVFGLGEDGRKTTAELTAARLHQLRGEDTVKRWDDIVCLFRASTSFDEYEQAFAQANIPFVTVAGRGFYERPEIRDLLNLLRALADPADDLAMAGLLRSPAFGLSDGALYQLRWDADGKARRYMDALRGDLSGLGEDDRTRAEAARGIIETLTTLVGRVSVAELLKTLLNQTNYLALLSAVRGERLQRNAEKLLADAYASDLTNVPAFLEYIETLRDVGAREGEAPTEPEGAVRLMTVHKAKGLEFPVVVLADAAKGRPSHKAPVIVSSELGVVPCVKKEKATAPTFALAKGLEQDREQAEDLRLLYVAATRAEEKLIVCAHETKAKNSWFERLLESAGITKEDLSVEPNVRHARRIPGTEMEFSYYAAPASALTATERATSTLAPERIASPIFAPLIVSGEDEKILADEDWLKGDSIGAGTGKLVHAALREWLFPGDGGFEALVRATSADFVLPPDQVMPRVTELLNRLRRDPRWQEMNDAPIRRHEFPFINALQAEEGEDGFVTGGVMDLFYQTATGDWTIVDFKTDPVTAGAAASLVRTKYGPQMHRYLRAAQHLKSEPRAWLCFLDCEGKVEWRVV